MAVQTIYLLGTTAVTPNWWGNTQLNGTAPTAANSTFGWVPAKTAISTPYWRGRQGASGPAAVAQAASYNAATSGPAKGTGNAITTAGDSFIAGPFAGAFAAGTWTFNFNLRAGTAGCVGRINMRVWRSANADGTSATQVLANTSGTGPLTLSTSADQNSSISTAAIGALALSNEYLFFQLEWQETTVGSSNGCNVLFRIGTSSITTPDFVVATANAWNAADKSASITLTNTDKTATVVTGTSGVRSTQARANGTAGKYYAEFFLGNASGFVGILDTTKGLTSTVDGAVFVIATGGVSINTTTPITTAPAVTNDVVCMAWDAGTKKVWFRTNNGFWNGSASNDPATGVGGVDASALASVNHALWFSSNTVNASITVRTQVADLSYTVPSGFKSWMNETPPTPDGWNLNDKSGSAVFSNNDKTSINSSGTGAARSSKGYSTTGTNKLYVEFVAIYPSGSGDAVGLSPDTDASTDYTHTVNLQTASNQVRLNNTSIGPYGPSAYVGGDVLCCAWDIQAKRLWARTNNGLWNNSATADPAAGVGGYDVSSLINARYCLWYTQNFSNCGATIRTTLADLGYGVPSGFTSWMGESFGPPPDVIPAATPFVDSSPTIDAGTLGQKHTLIPTVVTVGTLAIGSGVLRQTHVLPTASNAVAGTPSIGAPALAIVVPIPVAINLVVSSPVVGALTLGQIDAFIAQPVTAGAPVLAAGTFFQAHSLPIAISPVVPSPSFATGTFKQVHTLGANSLATSSPALGAPALALTVPMVAIALAVSPPTVAASTFQQRHGLQANALAVQPPVCGAATIVIPFIPLVANNLSATAPALGSPALQPTVLLAASNLATAPPVEAAAAFSQAHAFAFGSGAGGGSPVADGAKVYVNFLTGQSYVGGVGDVHITTLLGTDPQIYDGTDTFYLPDAVTPLGYDPLKLVGYNNKVALLGPLLSAVLAGGSVVLKFQSRGGTVEDYTVYDDGFYFNFRALGDEGPVTACYSGPPVGDPFKSYIEFDTNNQNVWEDLSWTFSLDPGLVNAVGFSFVSLDRIDLAANDLFGQTAPLVENDNPAAHRMACCDFQLFGVLASIAVYDTLPLAELRAKTVPVLDAASGGAADNAALVLSSPTFTIPSFNRTLAVTASPLAVSSPTVGAAAFAQPHTLTANALAATSPVLGLATISQAGVMAALPLTVAPPTLGVGTFTQMQVLTATPTTAGLPEIASAALLQQQWFSATSVTTASPSVGAGALGQQHTLTAIPLAVLAPVIPAAALGQSGVMACIPIVTLSPVIDAPAFGQKHLTVAQSFVTSAPALGVPALGKVLQAAALVVSPPVIGPPVLTKVLAATPLGTSAPVLAAPTFALRVFGLTPLDLTIGSPAIPAPAIGQSGVMAAVPPSVGSPVLGSPLLGQRHVITAVGASAGGPLQVPTPDLFQQNILTAQALAVGSPLFGLIGTSQRHVLGPASLTAGKPVLSSAFLGQAGVMAVVPLSVQSPVLPVVRLQERQGFTGNNLAVGRPTITVPDLRRVVALPRPYNCFAGRFQPDPATLGQVHRLNASTASAGAPVIAPATMFERETFAEPPLIVGSPVFGRPTLVPIYRVIVAASEGPHPVLGQGNLGQQHQLTARDLIIGRPTLSRPHLGMPAIDLEPIGFEVAAPDIGIAQLYRRSTGIEITGRPHLTVVTGQRTPVTITSAQRAAPPITGQRNGKATITGRRTRMVM